MTGSPVLLCARNLRRACLLLAASTLLVLGGCTTGSRATSDSLRLLFKRQIEANPDQVAANQYPQAQVRTPDLSAIMVLGFIDDGQQIWYAGNQTVFRLDEDGIVVGMSGNGRQLRSRIIGASPFAKLATISGKATIKREYDWIPGYKIGITAQGTLDRGPTESVDILGVKRNLVRFDERLEGGLKAHNVYWADATTGFIWKSRQQLSPDYTIELVQLKPYRLSKD